MNKVKILVVEDERIVSMDIQRRLKALGYEVVGAATTGEDAIVKAGALRPDLVLMDIMLDGKLDGIAAAETIRGRYGIAVIYLTAYADNDTLERAKVTEPFGYILKPFEERELHGHIEIALYKHRMERRLKESEERYMLATRGANDGLWDWDLTSHQVYYSPRWKAMLGFGEDEIGNQPKEWLRRLHPADSSRVKQQLAAHIKGQSPHFETEYRVLCKDGSYRWMLTRGMALRNERGKADRIAGSHTDITERKVYDPLTGLPNLTLFSDRVQSAIERARRHPAATFAVLSINLNNCRTVLDGLRHSMRDQLLIEISNRLKSLVLPGDTVARLDADKFAVMLGEVHNGTEATELATNIQQAFGRPFSSEGQEFWIRSSIGIALSSTGYALCDDLVRDADTAMHRAQTADLPFEIFDENMRSRVAVRMKRESDLRHAIEREELKVYYQPIIALTSGRIAGFEALVRWQHADGLLMPKDFIPLAEQSGLIIPLEKYVLRKSVEQMRDWEKNLKLRLPLSMSVNLSARHYADPNLVEEIRNLLKSTGVKGRALKLEITETALLDPNDNVARTIDSLADMDIQLAMDDFGTGYSSLNYLHQFPIRTLKIDQCFVSKLGQKSETRKIVQTIVALGKHLDMEVTAEGVENTRQVIDLQAFDCTYAQGYLFSKALCPNDACALLAQDLPWLSEVHEGVGEVFTGAL